MTAVQALSRPLLLMHGVVNVAQGIQCVATPEDYAKGAGTAFIGASNEVIQAVGLGLIGLGAYGAVGAYKNNKPFFAVTAVLRLLFAAVMFYYEWNVTRQILGYEISIAVMAAVAALS